MGKFELLSQRLNWAIERKLRREPSIKKITNVTLAKIAGVSPPAVGYWFADANGIDAEPARKVGAFLDVDAVWLEKGDGAPENALTVEQSRASYDINVRTVDAGLRPIPVISAIQAGKLKEISDPYPPGAGFDVEYTSDDVSPWTFALEIEGESMLLEFRPGDRVIIDPDMAPNPGDFVAAKNTREEATFKKYRPRRMDENGNTIFELVPLNPDYPVMQSDVEHLEIIGVMIEHRKRYRRPAKQAIKGK